VCHTWGARETSYFSAVERKISLKKNMKERSLDEVVFDLETLLAGERGVSVKAPIHPKGPHTF